MRRINRFFDFGSRIPITIKNAALGLVVAGAVMGSPAFAQSTGEAVPGPSAAGERLMMERAGLVPARVRPVVAPVKMPSAGVSTAPLVFGLDVQVNDPTTDTPESTTQSETAMAVNGNTICAGYNDSNTGFSGLARSADLGATWTDLGGIGQRGDPVIAVHDATGTFYYAEIATIGGNPAIGVAVSADDCLTFAAPVDASPAASAIPTTTLNDKPWIAIDNTGGVNDGNIYVCWTRFDSVSLSELRFSRSTDGGATYTNEQILAPAGTAPFGCSVTMGPSGEVNVSWADRSGATQDDIRFRRSTNAGVSFSAAISVSTGNRHPGTDRVRNCGGQSRTTLNGNIRMLHQSWQAADNTGGAYDGNLYIVWASDPVSLTDNSDVFFSRSTNGGLNWSAAVQLGIEAGPNFTDQFEPMVAVGGTGVVSVAWYDRRNDTANNNMIDVYKTFSLDGGVTFTPIARVTDVTFAPPPILPNFDPGIAQCYMGEYIAVAADANNFYYMWGDNRNILITANFPDGRPDPDVYFEAEQIPASNSAPVAVDNNYTELEDTQLTGNVITDDTGEGVDSDDDGDSLSIDSNTDVAHGTLVLNPNGSFTYDPDPNYCGPDSFDYVITDAPSATPPSMTSNTATVSITVTCVNDAPVAVNNNYTHDEDTQLSGNVITDNTGEGVDYDVDGDGLSIDSNTDVSHGTLALNPDGSFTYDPNLNYCGPDSFTYVITDDPPITPPAKTSNTATVSITVTCVNDPPVVTSVSPAAQTSDYSDFIGTVTIMAEDVDDTALTLAQNGAPSALPDPDLNTTTNCVIVPNESIVDGSTCTWTMDGQVLVPGNNVHNIDFTASDDEPSSSVDDFPTTRHVLTVQPEDASAELDGDNPVAVQVPGDGEDSGPFSLLFAAWETLPDFPHTGTAEFGDLNNAQGFMTLNPVGPGGPITVLCGKIPPLPVYPGEGYGQVILFECAFNGVPVNTYEILAEVDGLSDTTIYYTGFDEGVIVVYDPSLGFITGGGWLYWPGTDDPSLTECGPDGYAGDKTNFGFSVKYNKGKKKRPQGSILVMRHTVDALCLGAGNYKVKSNALDGLAIGDGEDADGDYGWASLSGKSTFRLPNLENEGNYPFLLYVEDHGEQGCNQDPTDEFWIEVKDGDGNVVLEINGPDSDPAGEDAATDGDDEPIECGNIIVPHEVGGKGKP